MNLTHSEKDELILAYLRAGHEPKQALFAGGSRTGGWLHLGLTDALHGVWQDFHHSSTHMDRNYVRGFQVGTAYLATQG
jgi:hypothetical protein